MAKQIKSFWLKLTACFLTLYFAPLGHFIMSLFGGRTHHDGAYGGTIFCGHALHMECGGKSGTYTDGDVVQCTCTTDSSKVYDIQCIYGRDNGWSHETTQTVWGNASACYYRDACSPNGFTQDCSNSKQYCTKTCTNGRWGPSVWGNCKSGYVKINNACTAECSISNGKGYEYEESSSSSSSEG